MSDTASRSTQAGDLRKMSDREGLILQGCGGDPQEWLEGINEMLTDAGILRNGSRFERASLFEYDGHTNMLFDFEGVDLDAGKLAVWRLSTYEATIHSGGQDANNFHLVGIAESPLREDGLRDQAKELTHRIFSGECHSYGEALCLIGEYVTITDIGDYNHNRRGKEKDNYER